MSCSQLSGGGSGGKRDVATAVAGIGMRVGLVGRSPAALHTCVWSMDVSNHTRPWTTGKRGNSDSRVGVALSLKLWAQNVSGDLLRPPKKMGWHALESCRVFRSPQRPNLWWVDCKLHGGSISLCPKVILTCLFFPSLVFLSI